MGNLQFVINGSKKNRVKTALKNLYPIPMIADPESKEEMIREFTEDQWVKECMRRWLIKQVARYEQKEAQAAVKYNEEDDLVV